MLMQARIVYEKNQHILVIFQKYTGSITFEELHCDPSRTGLRALQLTTWPEGRKRGQLPGSRQHMCHTTSLQTLRSPFSIPHFHPVCIPIFLSEMIRKKVAILESWQSGKVKNLGFGVDNLCFFYVSFITQYLTFLSLNFLICQTVITTVLSYPMG